MSTHEVEPVEGGAVVHDRFARPDDEATLPMMEALGQMVETAYPAELAALQAALDEAGDGVERPPEPDLPAVDEERRLATAIASP